MCVFHPFSFKGKGQTRLFLLVSKVNLTLLQLRPPYRPGGTVLQRSSNPFEALNENGAKKFALPLASANPVIHQRQRGGGGGGWGGSGREKNDFNSASLWLLVPLLVPLAPAGHYEQREELRLSAQLHRR